jgi:hypothetical protein
VNKNLSHHKQKKPLSINNGFFIGCFDNRLIKYYYLTMTISSASVLKKHIDDSESILLFSALCRLGIVLKPSKALKNRKSINFPDQRKKIIELAFELKKKLNSEELEQPEKFIALATIIGAASWIEQKRKKSNRPLLRVIEMAIRKSTEIVAAGKIDLETFIEAVSFAAPANKYYGVKFSLPISKYNVSPEIIAKLDRVSCQSHHAEYVTDQVGVWNIFGELALLKRNEQLAALCTKNIHSHCKTPESKLTDNEKIDIIKAETTSGFLFLKIKNSPPHFLDHFNNGTLQGLSYAAGENNKEMVSEQILLASVALLNASKAHDANIIEILTPVLLDAVSVITHELIHNRRTSLAFGEQPPTSPIKKEILVFACTAIIQNGSTEYRDKALDVLSDLSLTRLSPQQEKQLDILFNKADIKTDLQTSRITLPSEVKKSLASHRYSHLSLAHT